MTLGLKCKCKKTIMVCTVTQLPCLGSLWCGKVQLLFFVAELRFSSRRIISQMHK